MILLACFVVVVFYKVMTDDTSSDFIRLLGLPLNFFLCVFGYLPIFQKGKLHNPILELWGRQSLYIYLWHVLPLRVLKEVFKNSETEYYLCWSVLIVMATLATGLYLKIAIKREQR